MPLALMDSRRSAREGETALSPQRKSALAAAAAKEGVSGGTMGSPTATRGAVGRSVARRDAAEKLRGQALFAGDIVVPRMAHGKVLRSPVAHARIVSIDASEAERMRRRRLRPHGGRPRRHRPVLGSCDQGPACRGRRSCPFRGRARSGGRRRGRGDGAGSPGAHPRRVRGARSRGHGRAGAGGRTRRSSTTARCGRVSSTASAS